LRECSLPTSPIIMKARHICRWTKIRLRHGRVKVKDPTEGDVIAFSEIGGLHHRYERRACERRRDCLRLRQSRDMRRPRLEQRVEPVLAKEE
jgi:hypothetical protein